MLPFTCLGVIIVNGIPFFSFFFFLFSCVVCGGFLSPHFLYSRLIGLHMWPYLGKPGLMKFALKSISTHFELKRIPMILNAFTRFPSNAGNCFQRFKIFFQRFRMFFQRCSMHWQCFQTFFLSIKLLPEVQPKMRKNHWLKPLMIRHRYAWERSLKIQLFLSNSNDTSIQQ